MNDIHKLAEQPKSPKVIKVDGRLLRSQKSRVLIIEAILELIDQGNLAPTAQQTAERAGIGIRTVFRQFDDMESMFDSANELIWPRVKNLFRQGDLKGSLSERILHAIEQHAMAFEDLKNVMLSIQARRWRSATLRKNYAISQNRLRMDLDQWLPELADLSPTKREAVDATASFEFWFRLREHQGLSTATSVTIIVETLELLIKR